MKITKRSYFIFVFRSVCWRFARGWLQWVLWEERVEVNLVNLASFCIEICFHTICKAKIPKIKASLVNGNPGQLPLANQIGERINLTFFALEIFIMPFKLSPEFSIEIALLWHLEIFVKIINEFTHWNRIVRDTHSEKHWIRHSNFLIQSLLAFIHWWLSLWWLFIRSQKLIIVNCYSALMHRFWGH